MRFSTFGVRTGEFGLRVALEKSLVDMLTNGSIGWGLLEIMGER